MDKKLQYSESNLLPYEISYDLFLKNKILEAPKVFEALKITNKKNSIHYRKWEIFHCFLASYYPKARELCKDIEAESDNTSNPAHKADLQYCLALAKYYNGSFRTVLNIFFPKSSGKNKHSSLLLRDHGGNDYQLGHDYMLLGKACWKMGHAVRAQLYYYLAIVHFSRFRKDCIWIPKIYGLIGLVLMNQIQIGGYKAKESFRKVENCLTTAHFELREILQEAYDEHHIYACLENDMGLMKLGKGLVLKSLEEIAGSIKIYENASKHFQEATSTFEAIYKDDQNRFSATVYKNQSILNKRLADFTTITDKEREDYYTNAKKTYYEDIEIRTEKLFGGTPDKPTHHPTIGRAYTIFARLQLQAIRYNMPLSNQENKAVIYFAQMAIRAVVPSFDFINSGKRKDVPKDFEYKNISKSNIEDITSYSVLLQAYKLKIRALTNLYKQQQKEEDAKHIKETIAMAMELVKVKRKELTSPTANFALSNVAKEIYEAILEYCFIRKEHIPKELKKDINKLIFDSFGGSKNFELIQDLEEDDINFRPEVTLIEELENKFFDPMNTPSDDNWTLLAEIDNNDVIEEIQKLCTSLNQTGSQAKNKGLEERMRIGEKIEPLQAIEMIKRVDSHNKEKLPSMVISYFYGVRNIFIMYITANKLKMIRVNAKPSVIFNKITKYIALLDGPEREVEIKDPADRVDKLILIAQELNNKLLPIDFESEGTKFIVFSLHGPLNALPFDTLYMKDENEPIEGKITVLIEKFYTSYHYSMTLLYQSVENFLDKNQTSVDYDYDYIGIAGTSSNNKGHIHPEIISEIAHISKVFHGAFLDKDKIKTLLDNPEAIAQRDIPPWNEKELSFLKKTKGLNCRVLHIATHFSGDMNMIPFGENDYLDRTAINNIRKLKLALLAGCHSGDGIFDTHFTSLGRYFISKKAFLNTVFSITSIVDQPKDDPLNLIIILHEEMLKKRKTAISVSLGRAKRQILEKERNKRFFYRKLVEISGLVFYGCPLDTLED